MGSLVPNNLLSCRPSNDGPYDVPITLSTLHCWPGLWLVGWRGAARWLVGRHVCYINSFPLFHGLNTINLCHKHKPSWAAAAGQNLNWNHIYPCHNHHSPCILLSIMAIGPVRSTIHYNSSDVGMFLFESPFTHQSLATATIRICWLIKKVRSHQDRIQGVPKISRFANYKHFLSGNCAQFFVFLYFPKSADWK